MHCGFRTHQHDDLVDDSRHDENVYSIINNSFSCDFEKIQQGVRERRRSSISDENMEMIRNEVLSFEKELECVVISTHFSKNVPVKVKPRNNKICLESYIEGIFIKIIDVTSNRLNTDLIYPISHLLSLQSVETFPHVEDFNHDVIFSVIQYLYFLKTWNIRLPFKHLIVLTGGQFSNAYWNSQYMTVGSGNSLEGVLPLTSPCIIGHELTHGLIQGICDLEYKGYSGALNESYADIFGYMFECYTRTKFSLDLGFEIGTEIGLFMRSMSSPHSLGHPEKVFDKYWIDVKSRLDNGGVHINSSVINHLFYELQLIISPEKVFKIFIQTLYQLQRFSNFYNFKKIFIDFAYENSLEMNQINDLVSCVNEHIY